MALCRSVNKIHLSSSEEPGKTGRHPVLKYRVPHRSQRDQAGSRSLVFDLSITHHRFGSSSHVHQNGLLWHPQDLDAPLRVAAHRKINSNRQQYADNQNISFLPAIMSTSTRMHGECLRLLFPQAHRKTEAHFTAAGMPSQSNQSYSFLFQARGFLPLPEEQSRTRGGQSSGPEDQPQYCGLWRSRTPRARSLSRSPSPPPPSFTLSPSPPRSLVCDGQTSPHRPRLVVSRSTCPPLSPSPHANSFVICTAVRNTHTFGSGQRRMETGDSHECMLAQICHALLERAGG